MQWIISKRLPFKSGKRDNSMDEWEMFRKAMEKVHENGKM